MNSVSTPRAAIDGVEIKSVKGHTVAIEKAEADVSLRGSGRVQFVPYQHVTPNVGGSPACIGRSHLRGTIIVHPCDEATCRRKMDKQNWAIGRHHTHNDRSD